MGVEAGTFLFVIFTTVALEMTTFEFLKFLVWFSHSSESEDLLYIQKIPFNFKVYDSRLSNTEFFFFSGLWWLRQLLTLSKSVARKAHRMATAGPSSSNGHNESSNNASGGAEGGEEEAPDNSNFECNICLDTAKDAVISMCGHLFWYVTLLLLSSSINVFVSF